MAGIAIWDKNLLDFFCKFVSMIQPQELRIGNWVRAFGFPAKISNIGSLGDLFCENIGTCSLYDMTTHPIPLTPEILEKAGFDKIDKSTFNRGRLSFQIVEYQNGSICLVLLDGGLMCIKRYVHQLQNLYFAMLGKELQIEL